MKKYCSLLCFALLLFTLPAVAQHNEHLRGNGNIGTENRSVTAFTKLKVSGSFEVMLSHGNTPAVKLEGEQNLLPLVETKIENGTLLIRVKEGYSLNFTKPMKIYVTAQQLDEVALTGSGHISTQDEFASDKLELKLTGSGNIDFKTKADVLNAELMGSGKIALAAETDKLHAGLKGSGHINLKGKTDKADLSIMGSGKINASAMSIDQIDTHTMGSGKIIQ